MGNSLIQNTNVNKETLGNCGVNNQWQLHQGVRTDKGKDEVTVFLFDKKSVSKMSSGKEEFLAVLKREPEVLAKFKHAGILKLMDPLIEDQKRMGFVTERVSIPLNVLIERNHIHEIVFSELDIKLHILELTETINYLNKDVRAAHLSVSPENIYVMPDGKWKIGGFSFSTQILQGDVCESKADFSQKPGQIRLTPSLRFAAPEITSTPSLCTFTSDMFSLGCLIYSLYKIRRDNGAHDPYLIKVNSLHGYQESIRSLDRNDFSHLPEEIRSTVINMLNPNPTQRMTPADFINHMWFKDPFVQAVKALENIHTRDFTQQQNFLKGLATIILQFEPSFVKKRLIPVINSLLKNAQLAPFVLPLYFKIMEPQNPPILTREEFNVLIWPSVKTLLTGKEISAQALFILMQQMEMFVNYLDIKEIELVFVPLLLKAFECGVQKLQDLAIKQSLIIFDKIDYNVLKAQILPKILNLCIDNNVDLRKGAILMLSKTFHIFDSVVINDQILPMLEKLRKLNNNYTINMAMLTIFQGIAKDISSDVVANKILASLVPMLVSQSLSKPEYKAFFATVYSYLKKIEDEQGKRYEGMSDLPPEETIATPDMSGALGNTVPQAEEGQFSGDFSFLNSTAQKGGGGAAMSNNFNNSNSFPSFGSNQNTNAAPNMGMSFPASQSKDLDLSEFKDWNVRPSASTSNTNTSVSTNQSQNSNAFSSDWTTFSIPGANNNQQNQQKASSNPFAPQQSGGGFGNQAGGNQMRPNTATQPQGNQNNTFNSFQSVGFNSQQQGQGQQQQQQRPPQQRPQQPPPNQYNQYNPQNQQQSQQWNQPKPNPPQNQGGFGSANPNMNRPQTAQQNNNFGHNQQQNQNQGFGGNQNNYGASNQQQQQQYGGGFNQQQPQDTSYGNNPSQNAQPQEDQQRFTGNSLSRYIQPSAGMSALRGKR